MSTIARFIRKNMAYAAVDLGTNAFRLLIVGDDRKKILFRYSSIIGLGSYIDNNNVLAPPSNYYKSLDKIFKSIETFNVQKVSIVATSIFRDCINKSQLKEDFLKRYSYNLKIITSKREAKLTSRGALEPLDFNDSKFLVVDIGGGSTEVTLIKDNIITDYVSMRIGVVREWKRYKKIDSFTIFDKKNIFKDIQKKLLKYKFFSNWKEKKIKIVMNGGTPTTLAAIKLKLEKYSPEAISGQRLSLNYIESTHDELILMKPNERLKLYGMEKGREVVIIYGIFILISILKLINKDSLYVSDSGVLEGLIQEID